MGGINWRSVLMSGSVAGLAWSLLTGPGPRTAAIAGFSWWLFATIATWQWTEIGLLRFRGLVGLIVASLPILIVVTTFGAWLYQEKDPAVSHR